MTQFPAHPPDPHIENARAREQRKRASAGAENFFGGGF